jgi:hypothetical protein
MIDRKLVFCKKKYFNDIQKDKESYYKLYLDREIKNNFVP